MCFEPLRGDNRIQIAIAKIASAKISGHSALDLVMNDLEQAQFPHLPDRFHCIEVLKERAKTLGNQRLLESLEIISISQGSSTDSIHSTEGSSRGSIEALRGFKTPTHKRNTSSASSTSDRSAESDDMEDKDKSKEQRKLERFRKKYHQDNDAVILQGN
jgi:hypothetical protein